MNSLFSGVQHRDMGLEPFFFLFLSFFLALPSFLFSMLQYFLLFSLSLSVLFSLMHSLQTFLPLSPLFAFHLPCHPWTTGKQCCSVPGGLIKIRSRSNTLWHILIGKKKKKWMFALRISSRQQQQPSHHHHPLLEPGWPPAKINECLLVFSSKR